MKNRIKFNVLKPLLVVAVASLITVGCKTEGGSSGSSGPSGPSGGGMPSPGGGMPSPGGGMPSPGGGMPSPPSGPSGGGSSGGSSGGQSGGGSSGGSSGGDSGSGSGGGEAGKFPSGQSGDGGGGSSGGDAGSTGAGAGGGDVGAVPPPPSQQGGGGGGESSGESGESGAPGEENPFADADAEGGGDCGDTGVMPGGIGGMGQAGECIDSGGGGGGASASESDASASASGGGGSGGGAPGGGSAGSVGQFPEESADERASRLGRELDESIGGFDEALQEEQREIASAGRVIDGFDIEGGGGANGEVDESGALISLGTQTGSSAGEREDGAGGGNMQGPPPVAGLSQQEIEERTPDDIPVMVDDDIIARQLREAALVEKDPRLRERLWDEYRKYQGLLVAD